MFAESVLMRQIQLHASKLGRRLFRNNVGSGYIGTQVFRPDSKRTVEIGPRDIVIYNARRVTFGLCKGSSDLIGFRTVTVTSDMVGKKLAVFEAVEVKTKKGRSTAEQKNFIKVVQEFGGIGTVARSIHDIE